MALYLVEEVGVADIKSCKRIFGDTVIIGAMLAALLSLIVYPSAVSAENTILTISTGEWAPFVSKEMPGGGICREIVEAALAESGLTAEITFYPWKRAMLAMKSGQVMASFPWAKRADREEFALYSEPLQSYQTKLFFCRNNYSETDFGNGVEMLKKFRVGVARGYSKVEDFRGMGLNVVEVCDNEMGMQMLLRGYIDVMTESCAVGRLVIKNKFPGKENLFGAVDAPFEPEQMYMLFSKKVTGAEEMLNKFNKGLQAIKINGEYDRIIEKYAQYK